MSNEEVKQKFRGLASEVLPTEGVESVIHAVDQLHLSEDIHQLSDLLVTK